LVTGFFQFCGEEFFVGEEHLVFAGEDFAAEVVEGVSGADSSFSAQRMRPTGGFSPSWVQCSRA
jgi:hypothetical protein